MQKWQADKDTCICRVPGFDSQKPHGGPPLSITPLPGDLNSLQNYGIVYLITK